MKGKKRLFFAVLIMILGFSTVCYAGDIPETLLNSEDAEVFLGEVSNIDGKRITFVVEKIVKGKNEVGTQLSFDDVVYTEVKVGETYLCGFINNDNSLYVWEVIGTDPKTLKIKQKDNMSVRMQEYLNDGKFEEAQENIKEAEKLIETEEFIAADEAKEIEKIREIEKGIQNKMKRVIFFSIIVVVIFFVFLWKRKRKHK